VIIGQNSKSPDAPDPWPAVKDWLVNRALPLWATQGFDRARGSFIERLAFDGVADIAAPRRLIVQARQIYVYAQAHHHGWMKGAEDIVAQAADAMIRDYAGANGAEGWAFSADAGGKITDNRRNLYAQAFALFALAAAHGVTGERKYLECAYQTLAFLDKNIAAKAGGYINDLPRTGGGLLQNPHMHLLESLMALHEQDRGGGFDARAATIVRLFETRFFQKQTGILAEHFDDAWRPLPGERGSLFEPGHHYEWIWLLNRFDALMGGNTTAVRMTLDETAKKWGASPRGFLRGEVTATGSVADATSRNWPYTEAIKAALTTPGPEGLEAAKKRLSFLYAHYLQPAFPGGWIDKIDGETGACDPQQPIPASSFYHIACALSEYAEKTGG